MKHSGIDIRERCENANENYNYYHCHCSYCFCCDTPLSTSTICFPKDVLEVLLDSYISLADGKALLHLRNKGGTAIIITGLEIKDVEIIRKAKNTHY